MPLRGAGILSSKVCSLVSARRIFDDKEDSSTPQVQHDGVEVTPCSQLVSSSWKKELHWEQVLASTPLIAHGPSPRMSLLPHYPFPFRPQASLQCFGVWLQRLVQTGHFIHMCHNPMCSVQELMAWIRLKPFCIVHRIWAPRRSTFSRENRYMLLH
uniref:Uncharacterized protein n=1 Tax=Aegilops tauschii subsp. strangulata TaxID=200361 RepID=A0A453RD80_AEGTS